MTSAQKSGITPKPQTRRTSSFVPPTRPDGSLLQPVPEKFYLGGTQDHGNGQTQSQTAAGLESEKIQAGEIDFQALAMKHAGFAKILKKNGQVDFSEPESVKQLTLALALTNHALDLSLPDDRLCPPIPNRFNYIVFLQRLLSASPPLTAAQYLELHKDPNSSLTNLEQRPVLGIDIGTGASAIYPLLALRQNSRWRMLATELDPQNFESATQNVQNNGLANRCLVVPADKSTNEQSHSWLFPHNELRARNLTQVDFVMTNPPFYASSTEMLESARLKKRPPNSACTGAEIEMVYAAGGEVGWVERMIEESVLLCKSTHDSSPRIRVRWWTATLGKFSSVSRVIELLRSKQCSNYVAAEFVQGSKTKRWAVGWSWCGWRVCPPLSSTSGGAEAYTFSVTGLPKALSPPSNTLEWTIDLNIATAQNTQQPHRTKTPLEIVGEVLDEAIEELDTSDDSQSLAAHKGIAWRYNPTLQTGMGVCMQGDCWSRRARRARERAQSNIAEKPAEDDEMKVDEDEEQENEPKLVFRIAVSEDRSDENGEKEKNKVNIRLDWVFGNDALLWESFGGWVRRKLREGLDDAGG